MHILVVEDDQGLRGVFQRMLRGLGHTVILAGDGRQGIRLATKLACDAVLSDYDLGEGPTGAEVLRAVASEQPQARRVLMSADCTRGSLAATPLYGSCLAHMFLAKPFDEDALQAALGVTP